MKKLIVILALVSILLNGTYESVRSEPETPDEPQALGIAHGAYLRPATYYGDEVQKFNALVGKDIAAVMNFISWDTSSIPGGGYFNPYHANKIYEKFGNNSPAIMLTWEPVNGKTPGCSRNYSGRIPLNDIIAGNCDTYIRGFAQALQTPPMDQLRFLIRFGHEMNLRDSLWWPGHTGQDASAFVAAWRHVHDVFSQVNDVNAEWVWSPNYESNPLDDWNDRNYYYPGDDYVDWIGVDGYNWGSPRWDTFSELYDSSRYDYVLKDFACRYPKPQLIAEIGSVEGSSSKAGWIADTYSRLPNFPFVRGIFWFNDFAYGDPSRHDFRVTSGTTQAGDVYSLPVGSNAWTDAYRNALSNPIYTSSLPSVEAATPPTTYCQSSGAQFSASPDEVTLKPGESSVHTITGVGYTSTQSLSLRAPAGSQITGSFSPTSLQAPFGETILTLSTSPATPTGVYSVAVQGNGLDLVTLQIDVDLQPVLTIDHAGVGHPESTFNITGEDFPANRALQLVINGIQHNANIQTDAAGSIHFSLSTENAKPGYYMVSLVANPTQASLWFRLDENAEFWRETFPPSITMLKETQPWSIVFLPAIR